MRTQKLLATIIVVLAMIKMCLSVQAQTISPTEENKSLNMAKFNVLPLLGGKFSFEYERLLTNRISVGASVSMRPDKKIPFASTVKDIFGDEETSRLIDNFKSSNFSFTPEARFYLSKRAPFRGFYLAPYIKYTSHKLSIPYDYDLYIEQEVDYNGYPEMYEVYDRTETIPLTGNIKSFTFGFSMGTSFKLSKNIYLDWRILGPGYGTASGDVSGRMTLDTDEQAALLESLGDLKYELDNLGVETNYEANGEGARVTIERSPWAGIRTGLSIGYRF